MARKFEPGRKVVKNPETWTTYNADYAVRGIGVGVIQPWPWDVGEQNEDGSYLGNLACVKWPGGRCFENVNELLPLEE